MHWNPSPNISIAPSTSVQYATKTHFSNKDLLCLLRTNFVLVGVIVRLAVENNEGTL